MLNNNEHVIDYRDAVALGDVGHQQDAHVEAYLHKQDVDFLRRLAAEEGLADRSLLGRMLLL